MKIFFNYDSAEIESECEVFEKNIEKSVSCFFEVLKIKNNFDISVTFTNNAKIRELNKKFRNIDKETDVLSFPMLEFDKNFNIITNEPIDENFRENIILGDIVISIERARAQAEEIGHSLEREISFLCVHSMLHLFGFDHESPDDENEMFDLQRKIMEKINDQADEF